MILFPPLKIQRVVGFEVFTAVVLKSIFFWDMTPCSALSGTRRFGGTYGTRRFGGTYERIEVYGPEKDRQVWLSIGVRSPEKGRFQFGGDG
jgi:hypothetical protein